MLSAPARAISLTCRSGWSTIMCTSRIPPTSWTRSASAATITAPNVIGGPKWPSTTSVGITRALAASTSSTGDPSRAKLADRIEGATRRCRSKLAGWSPDTPSHRLEHAPVAVVAGHHRGARHTHDGRVLAAVGANRGELIALQAVDAAVATGHRGGTQPRLTAAGALGT